MYPLVRKRGTHFLILLMVLTFLLLILPGFAQAETVIFKDTFARADSSSPGSQWQEYLVRRTVQTQANAVPKAGETAWRIRGNTLYFEATGENKYIEDFVQTAFEIPVDNTRVEFEIRATGGTALGYIGPTAFWAPQAEQRRDAHNVTATGHPILGVQAWYRWENKGTKGIWLHGINRHGDHPQLLFSGLNQGRFAKHVITIKDGKLTYQSPDCTPLTYELRTPLEPGAKRHFSFGARLYDQGVKQTIEIRNLTVTSIAKPNPKLGDEAQEKLNEELANLAEQLRSQVQTDMDPMVKQVMTKTQPAITSMGSQISTLLAPVISDAQAQMQAEAQTQIQASQSMMTNMLPGGMLDGLPQIPQLPSGIPPEMIPQIPQGMFPGIPSGIPGMPQAIPSQDQIMGQILEQVYTQVSSQMQEKSQAQAKVVQPQIQALVNSTVNPLMSEMEQLAQSHAQSMVSSLNGFVDSGLINAIKSVKNLLPPEIQKLPEQEMIVWVLSQIEDDIKQQITAIIEDEVQSIVQERIITPIQIQVMDLISDQMSGVKSQITATVDSIMAGSPMTISIAPEIKVIVQEALDSLETCIRSDAEIMFRNSAPSKFLISVVVNGKQVSYDVIPIIKEGRTLVPLRAIAQSMDAQVQWNSQSQTISLTQGSKAINLIVGDNKAFVDNQQITLDVPATIVNGRTLVPARFISESLGAQVKWDQYSKTASIVTK